MNLKEPPQDFGGGGGIGGGGFGIGGLGTLGGLAVGGVGLGGGGFLAPGFAAAGQLGGSFGAGVGGGPFGVLGGGLPADQATIDAIVRAAEIHAAELAEVQAEIDEEARVAAAAARAEVALGEGIVPPELGKLPQVAGPTLTAADLGALAAAFRLERGETTERGRISAPARTIPPPPSPPPPFQRCEDFGMRSPDPLTGCCPGGGIGRAGGGLGGFLMGLGDILSGIGQFAEQLDLAGIVRGFNPPDINIGGTLPSQFTFPALPAVAGPVVRQLPGILGGLAAGELFGGGGDCPSLFRRLPERVTPAREVQVVDPNNPSRILTWKYAGRPVLYSGDLAASRRVRKVAARARRSRGGR